MQLATPLKIMVYLKMVGKVIAAYKSDGIT
jgi:hypothetical protein